MSATETPVLAETPPPASAAPDLVRPAPVVTYALLAALAAIFAAEILFGIGDWSGLLQPSTPTLLAFGALKYQLVVDDGEWHRLFAAPLLHLDLPHLGFNSLALFLAGRILEPLIGRAWFAAIFAVGGVGGAAMSLAVNSHAVVSVGASGAIMALFAAIAVASFHFSAAIRMALIRASLQVLIPSMLPLSSAAGGAHVDYGAHLGGALAGATLGLVLLALWRGVAQPRLFGLAAIVALAGLAGAASAAIALPESYRTFDLTRQLIPAGKIPTTTAEIFDRAAALASGWPRDPRAHFYQAMVRVRARNLAGAERELRLALSEDRILSSLLDPAFKTHVKAYLALVLRDRGQLAEAREMAAAACASADAALHGNVTDAGLCRK